MAPDMKYELSKTYQYRKVMKPLLERKRRARINKCLDELKDVMAEHVQQQSDDPNGKLEKADILELTVQHLRKLKLQKQQSARKQCNNKTEAQQNTFRSGYIQAANEVSRCLASLPKIDVAFGTKLMTHLGLRLNQLESTENRRTQVNLPLSINCTTPSSAYTKKNAFIMYSPVSSGYASDDSCSPISPVSTASSQEGLLQTVTSVWRPW